MQDKKIQVLAYDAINERLENIRSISDLLSFCNLEAVHDESVHRASFFIHTNAIEIKESILELSKELRSGKNERKKLKKKDKFN